MSSPSADRLFDLLSSCDEWVYLAALGMIVAAFAAAIDKLQHDTADCEIYRFLYHYPFSSPLHRVLAVFDVVLSDSFRALPLLDGGYHRPHRCERRCRQSAVATGDW